MYSSNMNQNYIPSPTISCQMGFGGFRYRYATCNKVNCPYHSFSQCLPYLKLLVVTSAIFADYNKAPSYGSPREFIYQ